MTSPDCHGCVLEYDAERGYGRIRDNNDVEYFVHYRDIIEGVTLNINDKVRFQGILHRKGNIARQVSRA